MFLPIPKKLMTRKFLFALTLLAGFSILPASENSVSAQKRSAAGVIRGVVNDVDGKPIANAFVAIFRSGTTKILKDVRSSVNGNFLTKVLPGNYTIVAIAEGFSPGAVADVQINRASDFSFGFRLERTGSGNTLPEKISDRNSSKWRIRAANISRSIYQNREGNLPIVQAKPDAVETTAGVVEEDLQDSSRGRSQSVVETFAASSGSGNYFGLNFATVQPINERMEILVAGQTGTSSVAPQRLEASLKTRLNDQHTIRFSTSAVKIGRALNAADDLGQISFQTLDEWKVREGVIVVVGLDYSRFVGAGGDSSLTPRLGLQFDANSKTRFHSALTTQNEDRTWSRAMEMEENLVIFRDQFTPQAVAIADGKAKMAKNRRLEFGVERVLDNSSTIEATAFFDTTNGRGVGLANLPADFINASAVSPAVVEQNGKTQGVRVVYNRRFGKTFSASAGYSFGNGQKLSSQAISVPSDVFENAFFQSFVGQVNADFLRGTRVKTIFRLSPDATVFAIDPFQGRIAIYDPSLSFLVTQSLPTMGLPLRAEAMIDARNLFDYQTGFGGEQGGLRLNSQRRILRGGIAVRF